MLDFDRKDFEQYLRNNKLDPESMNNFDLVCSLRDYLSFQDLIVESDVNDDGTINRSAMGYFQ